MEIQLGNLKNKSADLVKFLEEKAGIKSSASDDKVSIEGEVRKSDVKTYLKRFLYVNKSREDHKISVDGDTIKVLSVEMEEEEEEE
jgi:ribosomal protein S20